VPETIRTNELTESRPLQDGLHAVEDSGEVQVDMAVVQLGRQVREDVCAGRVELSRGLEVENERSACGRSVNTQVNATSTIMVRAAAVSPVIWLPLPAWSAVAVLERLPDTASPPENPAATLAAPMPTSSRFVSTR